MSSPRSLLIEPNKEESDEVSELLDIFLFSYNKHLPPMCTELLGGVAASAAPRPHR